VILRASLTSLASEVTQDPLLPYLMENIFWAIGLGVKPRTEKNREGCKARVKTVSRTLGWNLQYEGLTPTNQFLDGNAGQPMAKVDAAAVYTLSCREIRGVRRHCSLLAGAAVSRNMRCIDGRKRDIQRPSARALA
jgi:hypothetical protein